MEAIAAEAVRMLFEKMIGVEVRVHYGKDWDPKMKGLIAGGQVPYREEKNPDYSTVPDGSIIVWMHGGQVATVQCGHVCTVVEGQWVSDFHSPKGPGYHQMGEPNVVFVPTESE